jgi:hypothetical protein
VASGTAHRGVGAAAGQCAECCVRSFVGGGA